jgi:hypothetical protein
MLKGPQCIFLSYLFVIRRQRFVILQTSHVWYDMLRISPDSPEQLETINSMAEEFVKLIEKEVQAGIPLNRIVIGTNHFLRDV